MKLEHLIFDFDNFVPEMTSLKEKKHFDFLVTIIGEDFGEEGLGCVYILENTESHERVSVKLISEQQDGIHYVPSVLHLWKAADLLERDRALYEKDGIFAPALIDGILGQLRAFNDRTLRADIGKDAQKTLELVESFIHCG